LLARVQLLHALRYHGVSSAVPPPERGGPTWTCAAATEVGEEVEVFAPVLLALTS
jgi:hypothetical protein